MDEQEFQETLDQEVSEENESKGIGGFLIGSLIFSLIGLGLASFRSYRKNKHIDARVTYLELKTKEVDKTVKVTSELYNGVVAFEGIKARMDEEIVNKLEKLTGLPKKIEDVTLEVNNVKKDITNIKARQNRNKRPDKVTSIDNQE